MSDIQWPSYETLPWEAATPRNEPRVVVCVDVEPQRTSVLGRSMPHGVGFVLVYESDLPKVRAMVQTPEQNTKLAQAREEWDYEFEKHLASCEGDREKALATIGISVEAIYCAKRGCERGRAPLKSMVVGPKAPPPANTAATMENQAEILTRSFMAALDAMTRSAAAKKA